jgi:hypothetical protein
VTGKLEGTYDVAIMMEPGSPLYGTRPVKAALRSWG